MDKVFQFERDAHQIYKKSKARGDETYGIKIWYCSVELIKNGADIVFIGDNPGGGKREWDDDIQSGGLDAPYDENRYYQAWLDDVHSGTSGNHQAELQKRVLQVFNFLFKDGGEEVLRSTASFNVVPIRSKSVADLSKLTWEDGVRWCKSVVEHVSPKVIICLGNSEDKSSWSAFTSAKGSMVITEYEKRHVYNNFYLKQCRISNGNLKDTLVIGLPHLARVRGIGFQKLLKVAQGWEIEVSD